MVDELETWRDELGRKASKETIADRAADIVHWLDRTWCTVEHTLAHRTNDDLAQWYPRTYRGKAYVMPRRWTIWRIMAHDIHRGGQLSIMLAIIGFEPDELTALSGHVIEPPLVSDRKGTQS